MSDTSTIQSTTQQFLDVYDITNDVMILKNGAASIVLTVNAINFGLLAEEEQDAVIYQYAALLNSLNFAIQIVVRSQTKDATSYLQLIKDREDQTPDRVKREWIGRYREFVSNLIYERNVLDKKFYVCIPASYLEMGLTPTQNIVSGFKESTIEGVEKSVILEKALNILEPRRDHLISQFARIGLQARQLKTQEIIQLFYTSYNPEAAEGQQITDTRSYTTPLVQAQVRGVLMNDEPTTTPASPAMPAAPAATMPTMPPATPATTMPPASMPASEMPAAVAPTPPVAPSMPTPAATPAAPSSTPTMPGSVAESPLTTKPMDSSMVTPPAAPMPTMPKPVMPPKPPMAVPPTQPPAMGVGAAPSPATSPTAGTDDPQKMIDSSLQELGGSAGPTSTEEPPAPDLAGVPPLAKTPDQPDKPAV